MQVLPLRISVGRGDKASIGPHHGRSDRGFGDADAASYDWTEPKQYLATSGREAPPFRAAYLLSGDDTGVVAVGGPHAAGPVGTKPKTPASRKKAEPKPVKAASIVTEPTTRKLKKYSPAEPASILASVEKAAPVAKVSSSDDLQALVELEAENAELRKRLGKA
ncbi:MAG: hypothetical protein ACRECW_13700 [Phyllobacterium sp.]